MTVSNDEKLDSSDAEFVDVIHTNALLQGKIERCGHADFYMNGGIVQPGCFSSGSSKPTYLAYMRIYPHEFLFQILLPAVTIEHQTIMLNPSDLF